MNDEKFARTRAALEAFDRFTEDVWVHSKARDWDKNNTERERLARAVGRAFGLDTPECNSVETCESVVRPCAWVRRLAGVPERGNA